MLYVADEVEMKMIFLEVSAEFLEARWCLWKIYPTVALFREHTQIVLRTVNGISSNRGAGEGCGGRVCVLYIQNCILGHPVPGNPNGFG